MVNSAQNVNEIFVHKLWAVIIDKESRFVYFISKEHEMCTKGGIE